jgi:FAD/FMN-containing dehydrogenase
MTLLEDLRLVSATSEDLCGALAHAVPNDTAEVVAVLALARRHGVRVTVRGGGTTAASPEGTLLLSTRRLDRIGPVEDGTLTAGAGLTLGDVLRRAQRHRWDLEVDPVTQEAATVGGAAATGWDQVLGLQAVLLEGSVLDRLTSPMDAATRVLVGGLGAAGVITAVRMRLQPLGS